MLLVIHNLPKHMRFFDVKCLIQDQCGLEEVILDNFTDEGENKRVTVGLADEGDAALLVRKINGLYLDGCQLFVEDVRQKKAAEQPYHPVENPHVPKPRSQNSMKYNQPMPLRPEKQTSYSQARPVRPEKQTSYGQARPVRLEKQTNFDQSMVTMPMAYSNLPFYMSPVQNLHASNKNETLQMPKQTLPQPAYFQAHNKQIGVDRQWNIQPGYSSYPEQPRPLSNDDLNDREQWGERRGALSSPKRDHDRKEVKSSRYEQGYQRSHDREVEIHGNITLQSDKSRWIQSVGQSDRRDCSPSGRRDGGDRSSRRDDDTMRSQRSSYIERSPPRDRNFEVRRHEDRSPDYDDHGRDSGHNDKRRAIDHRERDRDRRRDSDRFEKPLDHDRYNEPRDYKKASRDKDYGHHDFGKKRPYSVISQTSSRSYGIASNANIFESREIESKRGGFNSNNDPKRLRLNRDKDYTGPGVHSKQNEAPGAKNKPDPPLRTLVNRHNNWRSQFAAMLAKEIIKKARPGGISYYPVMYKKLRECIMARIDVSLGDTLVSSLPELNDAYRSRFPPAGDVSFFNTLLQKIELDTAKSATDITKDKAEDKPKIEMTTMPIENAGVKDKVASLLASFKLPSAGNSPRSAAPPFQNRGPKSVPLIQNRPTSTPSFQNRAPNLATQFQIRAPTPSNLFQNRALNSTAQFTNIPPNPNPYYKNITNQQFVNRTSTTQFRTRAPASTPQFLMRAPTSTPQNQIRGLLSTPLERCKVNIPPPKFKPQKKGHNKHSKSGKFNRSKRSPSRKHLTKEAKQMHKMEFQDQVVYQLEPLVNQAIDNEMEKLIELYTSRPDKFMKNMDLKIHKRIVRETTPTFKKVLTLNLTKRILNIFTGLVLRVFPSGKLPNNAIFTNHMNQIGIDTIRKCPKMYVITCNSFEQYDHLLQMGTLQINDCQMTFKPMHVTGPRLSVREKLREREKIGEHSQIMGGENVHGWTDFTQDDDYSDGDGDAGIDNNDEEMDEADDIEQTDQDEVELVESDKEIVIIDDNDPIQLGEKECKAGGSGTNEKNIGCEQTENVVGDAESLDTNSVAAEQTVVSLEKEIETKKQNVDISEKEIETTEKNVDTSEKDVETTRQNVVTSEKEIETTEKNNVTSEKEIENSEQNVDCSKQSNETGATVTEDILKSEIISGIADDDLEDF